MILRLPQKLNDRMKGGPLAVSPLHENPLFDWSARTFEAGVAKYLLVCNTKSLYSVVLDDVGDDATRFTERVLGVVQAVLAGAGRRADDHEVGSVRLAKYLDRSVTGSMNELVAHATAFLADGDLSVQEVGVWLNEVLLSALGRGAQKYGRSRDEFAALVAGAGV